MTPASEVLPFTARVFVVDDDPVLANLLTLMLRKLGVDVEAFTTGQAALDAVRQDPPTLLLTDLDMDGLSGFQLLEAVKAAAPDVGVVIVTGSSALDDALRAIRSGALDYVTKPLRMENFKEVVARTLRYARVESLNRQYLAELTARDQRMRHELDLARSIQLAMLPAEPPRRKGIETGFVFAPSNQIGGDLFDFVELPDEQLGVLLADISGHGVPAALLSAMFKVLASEMTRTVRAPAACFRELHRRLARVFPGGHFASAFYGVLDPQRKCFTWTKAAQEPALLLRPGRPVELLEVGGPVLGMFDPEVFGERPYPEVETPLEPGDTLFLYTDGLVEAADSSGQPVTLPGLLAWLQEDAQLSPVELVERIHARVLVHRGDLHLQDDFTALAVRLTS
ncbi:MAG TPA: SpoIIE family protein phosphatase [Candidatus Xenobia bacterium]